jgi:hypothetical protein
MNTSAFYSSPQANVWEIDCKKISGGIEEVFGMLFAASDNFHFYRVYITTGGRYSVGKRNGDEQTSIISWTDYAKLNTGYNKENTLKVTKSGSTYAIFINGEQVNQFTDSAVFGDQTGFFVRVGAEANEDFPNKPVDVRFKLK